MIRHRPRRQSQGLALLVVFMVTFLAAGVGARASLAARSFYAQLLRPEWAPPGWLFAPVWTLLYVLMAIAMWLVWRAVGFPRARRAALFYGAQLIANALWTWMFFAWRFGALTFAEVLLLWLLIVATFIEFWRLKRTAAWLLLPYLGWVTFASALTFSLWQLNPTLLC
jgi:tryptophan-rich sensory protein